MNATNQDKGYNGWTNYETWAVNLWLTNDQASQDDTDERASAAWDSAKQMGGLTRAEIATSTLAEEIKAMHEEGAETFMGDQASVFADLLNAALGEVNWYEIARCFIDSARDAEKGR